MSHQSGGTNFHSTSQPINQQVLRFSFLSNFSGQFLPLHPHPPPLFRHHQPCIVAITLKEVPVFIDSYPHCNHSEWRPNLGNEDLIMPLANLNSLVASPWLVDKIHVLRMNFKLPRVLPWPHFHSLPTFSPGISEASSSVWNGLPITHFFSIWETLPFLQGLAQALPPLNWEGYLSMQLLVISIGTIVTLFHQSFFTGKSLK